MNLMIMRMKMKMKEMRILNQFLISISMKKLILLLFHPTIREFATNAEKSAEAPGL